MKRNDAINLLYKIYNTCQDITVNTIQIEAIGKKSNSNQEFGLVIKSSITPSYLSILQIIVEKYELNLSNIGQKPIIFSWENSIDT